jgi:2-polyprenyl-3-methyl-5-hydroxy-6-metoxy-1,4-benzoquinol methylase
MYVGGDYQSKNPVWHVAEAPWKASQILSMIRKHMLKVRTVCEVGCGAGEILSQLHSHLPSDVVFHGYDISPQAYQLCQQRSQERLTFHLQDLAQEDVEPFDLVLTIDVVEHVEDYLGFLQRLRPKGRKHIFHIPLDISVQTVLRSSPILRGRELVGHLHYFTKETALASLRDAGYHIADYCYTAGSIEPPNRSIRQRIARFPRKIAYFLHPDLAVRILGGYSLMVLAE